MIISDIKSFNKSVPDDDELKPIITLWHEDWVKDVKDENRCLK